MNTTEFYADFSYDEALVSLAMTYSQGGKGVSVYFGERTYPLRVHVLVTPVAVTIRQVER